MFNEYLQIRVSSGDEALRKRQHKVDKMLMKRYKNSLISRDERKSHSIGQ